jgi:hypothetical protein
MIRLSRLEEMKASVVMAFSRRRVSVEVLGMEVVVLDLDLVRMEGRFLGAVGALQGVSIVMKGGKSTYHA